MLHTCINPISVLNKTQNKGKKTGISQKSALYDNYCFGSIGMERTPPLALFLLFTEAALPHNGPSACTLQF